jgi:TRAP-type C4-dicarboxylate transport system permease small subunit
MGDRYHNLIGVDVTFNNFRKKIRRKLGAITCLLFLYSTWSSQNILILQGAYCK